MSTNIKKVLQYVVPFARKLSYPIRMGGYLCSHTTGHGKKRKKSTGHLRMGSKHPLHDTVRKVN